MGVEKYIGILDHEHHVSTRHPRMSAGDRAAQFAPFAALTGYEDVIHETGRLTDSRIEMDELRASRLDASLAEIVERIGERPPVTLTVFEKDPRKKGGRYTVLEGNVRTMDPVSRTLTLVGEQVVSLDDIAEIVVR